MPLYEYRCPDCGAEHEVLQKMDAPTPICPECKEKDESMVVMEKKVSKSGFKLEGGGWEKDGYG